MTERKGKTTGSGSRAGKAKAKAKPKQTRVSKAKPAAKRASVAKRSALKRPQLKAPSFASNVTLPKPIADVVEDLRERHLLPVAILLVVAIVAVPLLLSSGSEAPAPQPSSSAALATEIAPEGQPVVLPAGQGVRDYKKRLDNSSAKDPFVQQYEATEPSGDSSSQVGGSGETGTGSSDPGVAPATPAPSGSTGGGTGSQHTVRYLHHEIDAYRGQAGGKLKLDRGIGRYEPLPSDSAPATSFVGPSSDGKKAVFMISEAVSLVSGDGHCVMGAKSCGLVVLAPGKTMKLQFADGKIYAIKLVRLDLVVTKNP